MSRIRRNMGDSGKLWFYELDHESKMRLLKTHSHTSNGLTMEPGTREEKQLKKTQTLQQGKRHPSKTFRVLPVWRGEAGKALRQTNHRKGTMARRALVNMEGNTGANTREKSCEKPPAGHRHGGGLDEETTNTRYGRWQYLQTHEGGKGFVEETK